MSSQNGSSTLRILIADDNALHRDLALALLDDDGHQIDVVKNGREAVQAFRRRRYDLILLDCRMPALDGFAATKQIRQIEQGRSPQRRVPIIAFTVERFASAYDRCSRVGMDGFLTKPLRRDALRSIVERHASGPPEADSQDVTPA